VALLEKKAVPVVLQVPVIDETDLLEPAISYNDIPLNCLVANFKTGDETDLSYLRDTVVIRVGVPKSYEGPLANCKLVVYGRTFRVLGDPVPSVVPSFIGFNRTVLAEEVGHGLQEPGLG